MYGLNTLALAAFIGINALAYWLCKCGQHVRKTLISLLCAVLLGSNLIRYGIIYPFVVSEIRIPAEYSTAAYFAVPTILLLGNHKGFSWAAYSGLMAGFGYYLTMILLGGRIYALSEHYDVYMALFCHGAVYICGFVTIGTQRCPSNDAYKLVLGTAFIFARALTVRNYVINADRMFIYKLLDADLIKLLPQDCQDILLPVYYIAVTAIILLSIRVFFVISRRHYLRFAACE